MKALEFPATINVGLAEPIEGEALPLLAVMSMQADKLPFTFIVDTPDPEFVDKIVEALQDCATRMRADARNASYLGTHPCTSPDDVVEVTATPVEDAANSAGPAPGESE